jgi:serine/threonine-protein kinase
MGAVKAANIDQICNCSDRLKRIINDCLKFNPSQRYSTITRLSKKLSAAGKDQFSTMPGKAITIAVAGTQARIGVTHFAFRLCSYYRGRKYQCLYQERNKSGCIRSVKNRYEEVVTDRGVFKMQGIPMLAFQQEPLRETPDYFAVIKDYGCLTEECLTEFMDSDIKILILGAQDWELDYSEKVLNMVAEYKDVIYLFNFLSGRQFRQVQKNMNHTVSYRIPYEPDPFAKINRKNGLEFFEEIVGTIECRLSR